MIFAAACKFNLSLLRQLSESLNYVVMPEIVQHFGENSIYVEGSPGMRMLAEDLDKRAV